MEISKAATELDGFTGAELENIVNLSAIEAVRNNEKISNKLFMSKVKESIEEK
jgi:ATP-dependent Zn protease